MESGANGVSPTVNTPAHSSNGPGAARLTPQCLDRRAGLPSDEEPFFSKGDLVLVERGSRRSKSTNPAHDGVWRVSESGVHGNPTLFTPRKLDKEGNPTSRATTVSRRLLRLAPTSALQQLQQQGTTTKTDEKDEELSIYNLDRVLDHRVDKKGRMMLKIRWEGFDHRGDTWEFLQDLPLSGPVHDCLRILERPTRAHGRLSNSTARGQ